MEQVRAIIKEVSVLDLNTNKDVPNFILTLLKEMKKTSIKPLTNEEPKMLKMIASRIYRELRGDTVESDILVKLSKETFLQWRENREIGISILTDYQTIKTTGSTGAIPQTAVSYGLGCKTYTELEQKLSQDKNAA